MARYKHYSYEQGVMLPVAFTSQIVPGTIEHTINWLVDNKIDLSGISKRYINDNTGAPAYAPAILLKIILLAYSRGIIISRIIMKACRENIIFKALTGQRGDAEFCISALNDAIESYGIPAIFNTDQGCPFTSDAFTGLLKMHGIRISMDGKGCALNNIYVE